MLYRCEIVFRTASTDAVLVNFHLTGRSAVAVALYACHSFSMTANTILRMSPVVPSASAAVNSVNEAIGTTMSVATTDHPAIQVVGVLSKATVVLLLLVLTE